MSGPARLRHPPVGANLIDLVARSEGRNLPRAWWIIPSLPVGIALWVLLLWTIACALE
jgi:hypothetical protein